MERVLAGSFDFEGRVSTNGSGEPKDYWIDPVRQYLSEIGKIPLLSVEEERFMGSRMLLGRLAAISLSVVSQRENLPKKQVKLVRDELNKKGSRRLLACLEPEKFPALETLNSQVLEEKLRSLQKPVSFEDVLFGYTCWINEQLDCATSSANGHKRADAISGVIENQIALVKDGAIACEVMVKSNLRLVIGPAKRLAEKGTPLLDLIQEGNRGLIRAVEKFDSTLGYKFSTYGRWWIRQAVERGFADKARHVRLPIHVVDKIPVVLRIKDELFEMNGRDPSYREIIRRATEMGVRVSEEEIKAILFGLEIISLDTPVGEEEDSTVVDFVSGNEVDVEEQAFLEDKSEQVRQVMGRVLTERQRKVLELRYGIADGRVRTLEAVGEAFGFSRERARQIESDALVRLRKCGDLEECRERDPQAIPTGSAQILGSNTGSRRRAKA